MNSQAVDVSVVIPTRDRVAELGRSLRAVLGQETKRTFEVIVVNDGLPGAVCELEDDRVHIAEGPRRGPAAARNAGLSAARGDVVLFTDDDAVVGDGWLEAAASALDASRDAVGVEGPVACPSLDPLFQHAVRIEAPGGLATCNVGYRREVLLLEGGFDERFRYACHEDIDLGRRMARSGPILFVSEMSVTHPPRQVSLLETIMRARHVESEWLFHRKYPETRSKWWPVRWGPVIGIVRRWKRLAVKDRVIGRDPRRAARFAVLAGGEVVVALYIAVTRWRAFRRTFEQTADKTGLGRSSGERPSPVDA